MRIFFALLIIAFFTGCTDPMKTEITKENYSSLTEKIRKKVSQQEWEKIQAVQGLARLAGASEGKSEVDVLQGMTFEQAINRIQTAVQEQELSKLKAAQEEQQKSQRLALYIEFDSFSKSSIDNQFDFMKKIRLGVGAKNRANQDIEAFEGTLEIFDKLGNQLANLSIKSTTPIKAGSSESLIWEFPKTDFNNKMDEVFNSKPEDLKMQIKLSKILLKDGTFL